MNIQGKKDQIWILIAILWITVIVLGTTGHFVIGLVLSVPLIGLHMILGFAKNYYVSKDAIVYPFGTWALVHIVAFIACGYFADLYAGVQPPPLLGFHPSFAPVVLLFWLGGILTVSIGYYVRRDDWLDEGSWEEFKYQARKLREKEEQANV